jgi:amino acid transporter
LQVAFIAAMPHGALAHSHGWAGLTFTNDFGPLAAIATALGLGWLAVLLYIDAVASPADTGLIYTAAASRLGYAHARNGNAPEAVTKLTRTGVPWVATIIAFVLGLVILLPFPSWQQLVGLVTSATVLSFGSGPVVMAALRRSQPDRERPFRVPGGDIVPFLAFYSSNLIVFWAGWSTDWKLFVAVAIGFVLLGIFRATGTIRGGFDVRNGIWVIVWLVGLAAISYSSSYDGGRGWIGLGWGFLVNAVWTAIIYTWAVHVRMPQQAVEETIAVDPLGELVSET